MKSKETIEKQIQRLDQLIEQTEATMKEYAAEINDSDTESGKSTMMDLWQRQRTTRNEYRNKRNILKWVLED